jgi:hypothetical protein
MTDRGAVTGPAADGPRVPASLRTALGVVARDGLLLGAGSLVTVVVLHWVGVGVSPVLVVCTFVALRVVRLAVTGAAPARTAAAGSPTDSEREYDYRFDEGDLLRSAVRRWEQRLERSDEDPDRFARVVRPVVAEVVDERLRTRHGVTLESNPARARELLAQPLWQLLTDPLAPTPRVPDWPIYLQALRRL